MQVCFNRIIEYLQKKIIQQFTGSIKLSFENGAIVAIFEANRFDIPTSQSETNTNETIQKYIEMIKGTNYNGAIVFVFKNGEVIEYAYSRTYKGEVLQNCLNG